jgi:cellulose synthase/poly-beta-1,6-N-acetylglucosamine synthase-like glycosyltransferase/peptidoglycan/xylan/chitin deacetylase (PgdA/CDA1 family)
VHWPLLALLTTLVVAAFGLQGLIEHGIHPDTAGRTPTATAHRLGPVLDARRDPPRAISLPAGVAALTFDDGPDPRWTPRVLRVLAAKRVPATFFAVGARAARHPDILRTEADAGHEVAGHTFSNPDIGTAPGWRVRAELAVTQRVIEAATGRSTPLVRLPGTTSTAALGEDRLRAVRRVADEGYLPVLADTDTGQISGRGKPGLVIRFRDGEGDRAATVAALGNVIDALRQRGYRFATVSGAAGVRYTPTADRLDVIGGRAVIVAVAAAGIASRAMPYMFGLVLALTVVRVILLLAAALVQKRRGRRSYGAPVRDPVSVVVPAYNEEAGIAGTVLSLLASDHPVEIIVVDDGSTDGTVDAVERLGTSSVRLIRRSNGGKPAAINTGVEAATHDLIVFVDGDTVVEPGTVRELVQPFADPAVGAVAGNAKVANRGGLLGRVQHIEYVTGCSLDRRMYDLLRSSPTVPGAVGAFRRAALADAGGVPADTSAEDTDLAIAVGRVGWRVVYADRACAWTEVPGTLGQFWLQRHRWSYGTLQALWKHRDSFGRRGRFTMFGAVGMPYMLATNLLIPLLSPIGDMVALYSLLLYRPGQALTILAVLTALQFTTSVVAFVLDGERLRALWIVPFQQFFYRQVMFLVTVHSLATALLGVPLRWHKLRRAGLAAPLNSPPETRVSR